MMRRVLALTILAACGEGGDAPFEPVVQYEVEPSLQGFTVIGSDELPIYQLTVGLETCSVTASSGERYLLVLVPMATMHGETLAISSETSISIALMAGDAHASVTIQDPHPDAGVEFSL